MRAMDASLVVFDELVLEKTPAGIRSRETGSSAVYPNPSKGVFSIRDPGREILGYRIFNSAGQIVSEKWEHAPLSAPVRIDMRQWTKGIYFIEIRTGSGTIMEKLIIY